MESAGISSQGNSPQRSLLISNMRPTSGAKRLNKSPNPNISINSETDTPFQMKLQAQELNMKKMDKSDMSTLNQMPLDGQEKISDDEDEN